MEMLVGTHFPGTSLLGRPCVKRLDYVQRWPLQGDVRLKSLGLHILWYFTHTCMISKNWYFLSILHVIPKLKIRNCSKLYKVLLNWKILCGTTDTLIDMKQEFIMYISHRIIIYKYSYRTFLIRCATVRSYKSI
jgi:hypothetical protein